MALVQAGRPGAIMPNKPANQSINPRSALTPLQVPEQNSPISGLPGPLTFCRKSNVTSERSCGLEMPMHSRCLCAGGSPQPSAPCPSSTSSQTHPSPTHLPLCLQGLHSQASLWTARWSASSCTSPLTPSPVWTSSTGHAAASVGRSVASTASSRWRAAGATVAQVTASGGCGDGSARGQDVG